MKNRNTLDYVLISVTLLTLLLPTTLSSVRGTVQPAASQASSSAASGPANSPWPMYQHDAQRTSRSPYVGPSQPYLKWHYSISPSSGSSPSIAPDGTIYVGGIDEQFHAIRPNGTSKWMYGVPSKIGGSPAIADDGTVYIGHEDYSTGTLMAFNPDGSLEWSYPARGLRSSPAIAPDGTIYVGASNARLYAINPNSSLKWEYQPGFKESYSSPAIGSDGTIYVAGCKERNIHAVNPDGTTKWTYPIGTTGDTISSPTIDSDGTVYIGGSDNKLYALNPDGTLKWSYPAGDLHNLQQSAAIGSSGTVYIITTEGTLHAFTSAGDAKWTYSIGAGEIKTTPTVDANETIYFGARDGKVYAINPDGSEKWTFQTPADALGSTIAINSDGTLYVSGSEGVYAIGESGTPHTATIQGRAVDASTESGIEGVLVQAGTYTTTTGTDGHYSLIVDPGEYQVTARKSGYYASNSAALATSGDTVFVNFELTSRTGTGFGVWIGKYEDGLAGSSDQQVGDILEGIARNGGGAVYFPAYDPVTSTTDTIQGAFLFTGTLSWTGTITDISFNPSYTYSLSNLVTTAHSHSPPLQVYASIPCFVDDDGTKKYVIPNAPASRLHLWPHLKEVAQYLLRYGVDGIVLDFIRYSDDINDTNPDDPQTRMHNITDFVHHMVTELEGTELVVTTWSPSEYARNKLGQDLTMIAAQYPTAISPQLYATNNYTDSDLAMIREQAVDSRWLISEKAKYIPVLQVYDNKGEDHICQPGGTRLLAAIAAVRPADSFAVFAYEHISSQSQCADPEWLQFAGFIPQPGDADIIGTTTGTIVSGGQGVLQFFNEALSKLILTFHWAGGESAGTSSGVGRIAALSGDVLQVQVYEPDGTLYGTFDLTDTIEVITVPGAEPGTWECRVTTTSATSQRYTIVAGAVTKQVYLPMVLRN